jgi:replication factor C subunit 3/5
MENANISLGINDSIPWMEKYRPKNMEDIVLDDMNKTMLNNIIQKGYFPNLLFYGPPGTGKTTTIINLVNAFQEKHFGKNSGMMIHLNASDERGIDIIRNQIHTFVDSKPLFHQGMKFVILDEVDYMTKTAQQALIYLLQSYSSNAVRFCLICNYISRIEDGLQTEFVKFHFNQLPEPEILHFLSIISEKEGLGMKQKDFEYLQQLYKSDIRSMINFMQSKQKLYQTPFFVLNKDVWRELTEKIQKKSSDIKKLQTFIHNMSIQYNMDKKNIIKDYFHYLIQNHPQFISTEFLNFMENILHFQECRNNHYITYSLIKLCKFLR